MSSWSFEDLRDVLMHVRYRYLGPPTVFLSDQERTIASDELERLRDKFGSERWLAGSDRHHQGRGG